MSGLHAPLAAAGLLCTRVPSPSSNICRSIYDDFGNTVKINVARRERLYSVFQRRCDKERVVSQKAIFAPDGLSPEVALFDRTDKQQIRAKNSDGQVPVRPQS